MEPSETVIAFSVDSNKADSAPMQYPRDEIVNENDRIARTWMSVEALDKQKEVVPIQGGLKKVLNTWMKRNAPMTDMHTNKVIGRGLSWREKDHPETGKAGIELDYQIWNDYSRDHKVWSEIKNGTRRGVSFGGLSTKAPTYKMGEDSGRPEKYLEGIELYEVASVDNPANQYAVNTAVNYIAKNDSSAVAEDLALISDLQKGFATVDVQKPFAGFSDFGSCLAAQKERGHSDDSSARICGFLKNRTEKADADIASEPREEKPESPFKPLKPFKKPASEVAGRIAEPSTPRGFRPPEGSAKSLPMIVKIEFPDGSSQSFNLSEVEKMVEVIKARVYLNPGEKTPDKEEIPKALKPEVAYKGDKEKVEDGQMENSDAKVGVKKDDVVPESAVPNGAPNGVSQDPIQAISAQLAALTEAVSAIAAKLGASEAPAPAVPAEASMASGAVKAESSPNVKPVNADDKDIEEKKPTKTAPDEEKKAEPDKEKPDAEKPDEEKKAEPSAVMKPSTSEVQAAVEKTLGEMGIRKGGRASRPNAPSSVPVSGTKDPVYEMMKKAMSGEVSIADMNRTLRTQNQNAFAEKLNNVLGRVS